MIENHYLVPTQLEGLEKDISHSITTKSAEDAEDWFVDAKERLLAVSNWKKFSGVTGIDFRLTDIHGKAVNRSARKGDHIRIDADAQAQHFDGGFEWAVIEAIEYDDYPDINMETFAMRVRPSSSPVKNTYSVDDRYNNSEATSTFVIERVGKILSSYYYGRNEEVETGYGVAVAAPAWLGLADMQCRSLVKGMLG